MDNLETPEWDPLWQHRCGQDTQKNSLTTWHKNGRMGMPISLLKIRPWSKAPHFPYQCWLNDRWLPQSIPICLSVAPLERAMTRPKAVQVETPGCCYSLKWLDQRAGWDSFGLAHDCRSSFVLLGLVCFGGFVSIISVHLQCNHFLWLLGSVQWSRCNLGTDSPFEFLPSFDLLPCPIVPNSRRSVKESNATMSHDIRFVHSNTCGRM
jgi:hypothetical protein